MKFVFKLPDLGEGTVDAEIVAWHVRAGETVVEDAPLVDMMTDKATVEIPSPVSGTVVSCAGEPGDVVPVGAELVVIETEAATASATEPAPREVRQAEHEHTPLAPAESSTRRRGKKPLTSPAVRAAAREAGIDLAHVPASGPKGRISRADLDRYIADPTSTQSPAAAPAQAHATRHAGAGRRTGVDEIRVIGVRRLIAQRMSEATRTIPHFSYVEEIDVSELEALRQQLNRRYETAGVALTYLPFLCFALVRVLEQLPLCNATYDAERGMILRHHPIHIGVATHTPDGLKVPVVRHAEARSLWDLAREIRRVSEAARDGSASREDLTGSTITVTSLGRLGGIASTPVINAPEVAIVGVNRSVDRPMAHNGAVAIRRMMNLSSSFDHRFVDGYDAAAMIQALKERLEHPALAFVGAPER